MAFDYDRKPIVGYMCRVDAEFQLGEEVNGTRVYASIEDLKSNRTCWQTCGIVEVEVQLKRLVVEGND